MQTSELFVGKVVLITGSTSGIGAGAVIEFARHGAQVVITGRNIANMSKISSHCTKISDQGLKPLEIEADISKLGDCKEVVSKTIAKFGRLDILVNNVGRSIRCPITNPDILDTYQQVMDLNLRSALYVTHLAIDYLAKTQGCIINISSTGSLRPQGETFLYRMSKNALDMFTKCLSMEVAPFGIRVNAINPGIVRTNLLDNLGFNQKQKDQAYINFAKKIPLGRVGEPNDLANAIIYLASNEASHVTGAILVIAGGPG